MKHSNQKAKFAMRYSGMCERGVSTVLLLVIVILVSAAVLLIYGNLFSDPSPHGSKQPPIKVDKPNPAGELNPNLVRGYLAVAIGQSAKAESGGIYTRGIADKDIYLPGVNVYLENPQTGKQSDAVRTDLSGRFTLYAPEKGRYRLCWKSKVYDSGCTQVFISTGSTPQFLSTVNITLPRQKEQVAISGHVTSADGSIPRTFDPLININAFATVSLDDDKANRIAEVYVNNYGDYLLPYVPVKQRVTLNTRIESATFTQEIRPEAQIEVANLHQVNLRFDNHRPSLDPLLAFDAASKRRVQTAAPGAEVTVEANARDKDGDAVKFTWFLDSSAGSLSQTTGAAVQWKLPTTPGRHSVTVVAYDNKGGYDKTVLSVLVDSNGVPFTGVVVTPNGAPVKDASVEVVGNPLVKTDANGRFQTHVKEADRYVFNVRKEGYALNSRIYDRAQTGGRWILRPGQIVTIDPTRDETITHKRSERDCPGPDSTHAGLGAAGEALRIPQWQDGNGNVIDPPPWWDGPRPTYPADKKYGHAATLTTEEKRQPVILPRDLQLPGCGPGVTVAIPAGSVLDADGNVATAPFQATIATVDVLSPQQMPGDDAVLPLGGGGAYIQSYGAGSLDLPPGFKLKPGAEATLTIPADRARLTGGTLPATVPLLAYDEDKGVWVEENTLKLDSVSGVQVYVGKVKHFTSYNADTFFNNAACLRVFSPSLPGNYDLEVMSPYPDGTPHYKKYPIDNLSSTEHVIYNITPNANMTLAPMTQGAKPQLLGFYIVNSGPPQNPSNSPAIPPLTPQGYTSCQNFVVLKAQNAPDSPFGGEFLHGLGFVDATNLGFDDLTAAGPTGNALRDAVVNASKQYYNSVDPGAGAVDTLVKFKAKYGFGTDPNVPAAGEIVAAFANSGDLGFGRDMHCINKAGDIGCYVTNYGDGYNNTPPGGGTNDQDDADASASATDGSGVSRVGVGNSKVGATVAMEYAQINNVGPRVVKFFVYKNNVRSISANLDGRGERPVPQLCMMCHGGQIPSQAGGVPAFNSAANVDLHARFLPFDYRLFTFPASAPKAAQDAAIKTLNKNIVDLVPTGAAANDPIREVVKALYDDGSPAGATAQILDSPVTGWKAGQPAPNNFANQTNVYNKVVANACRTCHIAQPFPQLQFNTSSKFVHLTEFNPGTVGGAANGLMLGTAQSRVCGDYTMPHALRTHDIFWQNFTAIDPAIAGIAMPNELQNFGNGVGGNTWKPGLCQSFITGAASTPSQFYKQTIQPIWNGKCVGCHVGAGAPAGLPLTEGVSYGGLVPARVVPGNDDPAAAGNKLLERTTAAADRMPPNCFRAPEAPNGNLPCLLQADIDKIKAWIRSGAH